MEVCLQGLSTFLAALVDSKEVKDSYYTSWAFQERRVARHRSKHAATRLPPEARSEILCRRCQRYKHAQVMKRPSRSYGKRLRLVEGTSPRGQTYHCTDKAGYIYSAPL
jgi:hypothetical protein